MADGELRLLPDLPFSEQQKRALEEIVTKQNVNKAEGDPALARFHDLRVEEVSLVDAAANEEDFFIIKRRKEMTGKPNTQAADAKKNEPTAAPPEQGGAQPAGDPPTPAPAQSEPTIAQQVAEGVKEGVKAAIQEIRGDGTQKSAPAAPAPEAAPADDPVTKGFKDLGARLDGIDKRLNEQDQKLSEASTVRAAAKGQSVPDSTAKAEDAPAGEPESKWAGSAVHSVFGKRKRTA
jgi:hypothetical protein